ncbi:MAG: type II toxin-antitoxin system VapB family antitoxin [Candidatus Promineifilaceae bacterium]
MRTNIVIDDDLMAQAQQLTGIQTKKGVVEEALRLLIQMHAQAQVRDLRGQLSWEGNLDSLREGRFEPTR